VRRCGKRVAPARKKLSKRKKRMDRTKEGGKMLKPFPKKRPPYHGRPHHIEMSESGGGGWGQPKDEKPYIGQIRGKKKEKLAGDKKHGQSVGGPNGNERT